MKTTYAVSGMTCGHCASHVTEEVQAINGVDGVTVDWESGQMVIDSSDRIPFDAIAEAVAEPATTRSPRPERTPVDGGSTPGSTAGRRRS